MTNQRLYFITGSAPWWIILVASLYCLLIYGISIPDLSQDRLYTREDGIIENLGALAFLIAAALFIYGFVDSKRSGLSFPIPPRRRNIIYLLLGLLFFFAFGEEISWGQRIFGWETPEGIKQRNFQEETNLHNLDFFRGRDRSSEADDPLAYFKVVSMGRLFAYFWVTFFLIVPLLHTFCKKCARFFAHFRLPIAPLWIGLLMVFNLVLSKAYLRLVKDLPNDPAGSLREIMETNNAIIISILAIYWIVTKTHLSTGDLMHQTTNAQSI